MKASEKINDFGAGGGTRTPPLARSFGVVVDILHWFGGNSAKKAFVLHKKSTGK